MKYRDRLQEKNIMYTFIGFLVVFFLASYTFDLKRPFPSFKVPSVIVEDYRFTDVPEPRSNKGGQINIGKSSIFKKVPNFNSMSLEEKMQRWEGEYQYRSVHYNMELKAKLANILIKDAPNGATFMDSGGHVGDTSIPMLQTIRKAGRKDINLIIVEPDYSKCMWITRLVMDINATDPGFADKVNLINGGMWSHGTRASIERNKQHPGAWSVTTDEYKMRDHMKKRGNRLNTFKYGKIHLYSIGDIVPSTTKLFLWHLDVEGSEARAMLGLSRTKHRPIIIFESMKKNNDFLFNTDFLRYNMGYKQVERLPPNSDRLMYPKHLWREEQGELPSYI